MDDSATRDFAAFRARFSGAAKGVHFETSAMALMPDAARAAMMRYVDERVESGGDYDGLREVIERVRAKMARVIHAEPDEIAFTKSVSEGLNLFATAIEWQAGDNAIVCSELEHPNSIYALSNLRDRHGIAIRSVRPGGGGATPNGEIARCIDERSRLVIASSVAYTVGSRTDLGELSTLCAERGVHLLVDGAQSIGALDLNVSTTPIDALAVGASKYLCGPHGIGFLFVRRKVADGLRPAGLAVYGVDLDGRGRSNAGEPGADYALMPGARRFELGIYNFAGAFALEASLDLLLEIGIGAIEQHVLALARAMASGLAQLGLPVLSAPEGHQNSHVVVVGTMDQNAAHELVPTLERLHTVLSSNNVRASMRQGRLRLSFHLYNVLDEIERTLELIEDQLATP